MGELNYIESTGLAQSHGYPENVRQRNIFVLIGKIYDGCDIVYRGVWYICQKLFGTRIIKYKS